MLTQLILLFLQKSIILKTRYNYLFAPWDFQTTAVYHYY